MSSTTAGWAGPTWASPPRPTAWWCTGPPTPTATPPAGPGSCSSPRTAERPGSRSVSDPGHRAHPGRQLRVAEPRPHRGPHTVVGQQRRDPGRVDEHVLVPLATAPPRAAAVGDERGDVTDVPVRRRRGELG